MLCLYWPFRVHHHHMQDLLTSWHASPCIVLTVVLSVLHTHTYYKNIHYTISGIAVCCPHHEVSGSNGSMYTYMTGALGKMLKANITAQSYERTAHSASLVLPNQSQSAIFGDCRHHWVQASVLKWLSA